MSKLLLASGGHGTIERRNAFINEIDDFLKSIKRVLFIPYALKNYEEYLGFMIKCGYDAGRKLESIHAFKNPKTALMNAEAIFVGGGNTFRLLNELYKKGLVNIIWQRVLDGMPYIGVSAGSNVACPTIKTTNDMPIVYTPSLSALNLVPFQINPHYTDGTPEPNYFGETRERRIQEFHKENYLTVVGLREGSMLRIEGKKVFLLGVNGAKIFVKGQEPKEYSPGDQLDFLLD